MFPIKRSVIALSAFALAACGSDTVVNPVTELLDGNRAAVTASGSIVATYNLTVGQSVKIQPKTTSRTNRLSWNTTNSSIASVNSQGTVNAKARGTATVTVSGSGVLESYAINVASATTPTVTSFSLQPKTGVSLQPGQSQQFTPAATWSDGFQYPLTVTYSATGGSISGTGLFTAGNTAGTFMVIATCACTTPAIADTAIVSVVVPQLTSLTISPKTPSIALGATQQFAVAATWNTGATTVPPVTWSATGGTVSATGLYTAPTTAGTYRVIVAHTNGTVSDTALITVGSSTTNTTVPGTFGPGANAPTWSNKTVYPQELFNTPLPVHPAAPNSAGFKGAQGFDGAYGIIYRPTRVTYPVVTTPLGTKSVLQVTYPGSSRQISAVDQATVSWPTNQNWSVSISGTWSGSMVFERSTDGVTWTPVSMQGAFQPGGFVAQTGSVAQTNGVWFTEDVQTISGGQFRVRSTSWNSGVATVAVGIRGGEAPARMPAGSFSGRPTRIYTRILMFVDSNWTNGGNVNTKFFFFSQDQGNNHFAQVIGDLGNEKSSKNSVILQAASNRTMQGNTLVGNGRWLDLEFLFIANTPGFNNGTVRSWVNGVESQNYADVLYFVSGTIPGFTDLFMDPTYGGGLAPPPRNVFFRIAGWYRESAP